MAKYSDNEILELFQSQREKAIEVIFEHYYNYLCHAVYKILKDRVQVEDIVQEVFYEFWKKKDMINIKTSLKAYLRRSAVNKALNFIRDQKVKFTDEDQINEFKHSEKTNIQNTMEYNELQDVINQGIESLPVKCRMVFGLSRFEGMTYKQIAAKLDISTKTVENQISKALRLLREYVNPYLKSLEKI